MRQISPQRPGTGHCYPLCPLRGGNGNADFASGASRAERFPFRPDAPGEPLFLGPALVPILAGAVPGGGNGAKLLGKPCCGTCEVVGLSYELKSSAEMPKGFVDILMPSLPVPGDLFLGRLTADVLT
mmetsp:Transcript_17819/g.41543  ORF Transcript_17819/g.41543 Transcript_17819/m.41543 type:complete len:127 (+) Transcript_17819:156-536(+)